MKRFLSILMLCIVMAIPVSTNAKINKTTGNLTTEYTVQDDLLNVKKEIEFNGEYETDNLEEKIKVNEDNDQFDINSVTIEDSNGKREINVYSNNKEEDYYMLGKENKEYKLSIHLKSVAKVKKAYIEYSYKNIISHSEDNSFSYIKMPIRISFMNTKLDNQKIRLDDNVKSCWINKSYDNFDENNDVKEIVIGKINIDEDIILAFDKENKFINYEEKNLKDPDIEYVEKNPNYTKLFGTVVDNDAQENEARDNKNAKDEDGNAFLGGIILIVIAIIVLSVKSKKFRMGLVNGFKNTMKKGKSKYVNNKEKVYPFNMPSYINPAYLGILFNTTEEDIIFTVLCELIRRDAIEIKVDENYRAGIDTYRKYILAITENNVELESFENIFIEKLREMDEIKLINLEDINKLVGKGYFALVVKEAEEDFNKYLRANSLDNLSIEEMLKNRNIELDKWNDIKKKMSKLKEEEMKKLTIKELELLHVFSTAVALRDKKFSLFKVFDKRELRMSKYFSEIQQTFDNGDTVLNYLETTFLK